jgi:hypothetical protein
MSREGSGRQWSVLVAEVQAWDRGFLIKIMSLLVPTVPGEIAIYILLQIQNCC